MTFTDARLSRLAGEAAFKRGCAYARDGVVEIVEIDDNEARAIVSGSEDYEVVLSLTDPASLSSCDCPAGGFCKHLVATALVLRVEPADQPAPKPKRGARGKPAANPADRASTLRDFLDAQKKERLVDWLLELADQHPDVANQLHLRSAGRDPLALRHALAGMLRAPRFLHWRESRAYAGKLVDVVKTLASVAAADAQAGLLAYEYTLPRLLKIYGRSDDSAGSIGEQLRGIAEGHRACLGNLPPGGAERAKTLLALQRADDWDLFPITAHWSTLNTAGQAAYARAVEADYAALPPSQPASRFHRPGELGIIDRMEKLAMLRGETDTQIGVIARDLSSGYAYERIVDICGKAGREREALQWAERGLKAHPNWGGMRALVAEQYLRAGLNSEADELLWQDFEKQRDVATWRRLKKVSGADWPRARARALAHVQSCEDVAPDGRREVSRRIELLMADGDIDSARRLGEENLARPETLARLAEQVMDEHPATAAGFLRRVVDHALPRSQQRDYARLAQLIRQVMELDSRASMRAWLAEIRERYRARRKFMELLAGIG